MIEDICKGGIIIMDHGIRVGHRREWKTGLGWVDDEQVVDEVRACSGGDTGAS